MVFKLLTLRLVIQEIIRNNGTWLRNKNEIGGISSLISDYTINKSTVIKTK